jgi:hypothetical protein
MSDFSLDVAFNSATVPFKTELAKIQPLSTFAPLLPIYAMGFGFAESKGSIWEEDGQRVEVVPVGVPFFFSVFDTAPKSKASVTNIEITFFDPDNPHFVWPYSPLALPWEKTNQPNPLSSPPWYAVVSNQSSAGCNVSNAAVWRLGPYVVMLPKTTAVNALLDSTNTPSLTLGCTVRITVLVDPKDPGSTKVFSVDPEIQVDGGG